MSEHAPDRLWSGIDIPKTIAGVLAAVSAAVVGSFLGVAGTLAGAAIASIVGSVGTEIYHRSIERGKQRLAATFVTAPAAVGTPSVAAAEQEVPSTPEPPPAKKYRWGRVALVAGALFVLAMGALSAFELTAGESVPAAVGATKSGSSTTVGAVFGDKDKKAKSTKPATSPSPSSTSGPGAGPSDEPSGQASGEPSADASAPTSTEPSADPSSAATTSPEPASTGGATSPPAADSGTGGQGKADQGTTQDGGAGGGASTDTITPEPDGSGE